MYKRSLTILPLLLILFASCKVEFSPNAPWQEVPAVYCLLDQDDDTTYVRVQKCFLGDNSAYEDAKIYDSINYAEGALDVYLQEWNATETSNGALQRSGSAPKKTYTFSYQLSGPKQDGTFNKESQPVYACRTQGQLDSSCLYRLVVLKHDTHDTLATATTQLLRGNMTLTRPNNITKFDFTGAVGNKKCHFEFSPLTGGRRYQPMIRFYYREFRLVPNAMGSNDTIRTLHSLDIETGVIKSNMQSLTETYDYSQGAFLNVLQNTFAGDTLIKNAVDTVDIYIRACNEDLAQYLYTHELNGNINQTDYTYTNIINGNPDLPAVGVFAARRTHIKFTIQARPESNSAYKKALYDLHVGFGGVF